MRFPLAFFLLASVALGQTPPAPVPTPAPQPAAKLSVSIPAAGVMLFDSTGSTGQSFQWACYPEGLLFQVADGKAKAISVSTDTADKFCTVVLVAIEGTSYDIAVQTVPLPAAPPVPVPPVPPTPPTPPAPPVPTATAPYVKIVTDGVNASKLTADQQKLISDTAFLVSTLPGRYSRVDVGNTTAAKPFVDWLTHKSVSAPALVLMDQSAITGGEAKVLGVEPLPANEAAFAALVAKYTSPASK